MKMSLAVYGAAHTVTGSCYLLQAGKVRFLVDCGMFQGTKTLKELNYGEFPFDPKSVDFMMLTHAHIDHSGLIPKLVKRGFKGPIYATGGSIDLLSCMLPDSGHIQEFEVRDLNRRNKHRGRPQVTPIYTVEDAHKSLDSFEEVEYDQWMSPAPGIRARYWNAGHILGSASIEIEIDQGGSGKKPMRLLFSGDIGGGTQMFHPLPEGPTDLDYLICESTYGGRERKDLTMRQRRDILKKEILDAFKDNGTLIIPAFAVERTQELLADIVALTTNHEIPAVPIFLDSPLAIRATEVFIQNADELENGDEFRKAMRTPRLKMTVTPEESMAIERMTGNHIVMAASGMCDAGRIRHHLKNHLWRENSTVLLTGYQARGTLGRILSEGAKAVRIQGEEIKVRARIRETDMYSGHADGKELLEWIGKRGVPRKATLLVHGEEEAMSALHSELAKMRGSDKHIIEPDLDDMFDLLSDTLVPQDHKYVRRLPSENMGRPDWHNDLSALWLDISDRLDHVADDKARGVIIRRLRRALEKQ